jgi:hypothetical protein
MAAEGKTITGMLVWRKPLELLQRLFLYLSNSYGKMPLDEPSPFSSLPPIGKLPTSEAFL